MEQPIITISTGKIRGKTGTNINNEQFYSFQGIPYAKPPLGELRFKAPQPPESWTDVRDATTEGDDCIQRNQIIRAVTGSEDCLTLNVYTPTLSGNRPVMVWIHGGGFVGGSGSTDIYGPEFLMTEDIVLVTINYRLGIFGFLSLEDPDLDVPGNAGLKDMVMALKWVQSNVGHFSGDPTNVTIFGESAGAAASHYLVLSPLAKGLFHKAILQSGCALNVWAKGSKGAKEIAKVLGINATDERDIFKMLQEVPADKLLKAAGKIPDPFLASVIRPFGPVVERRHKGAFLSEDPSFIIKSGDYNKVPIVIGFTDREGILSEVFQKPKPFKPLTDFELAVPNYFQLQRGSDISKYIASQIKEFYYGTEEPSDKNKDNFYLLETDNLFLRELLLTAKYHSDTSSSPVFLYRMSVETTLNMLKNIFQISEPGVCHADDLGYLFKNLLTPEITPDSEEDIAIKRFVHLWTNFAKFGDPNPKVQNPLVSVNWKPVTPSEMNFLDIGKNLKTGVDPDEGRMAFWEKIIRVNPVHKL